MAQLKLGQRDEARKNLEQAVAYAQNIPFHRIGKRQAEGKADNLTERAGGGEVDRRRQDQPPYRQ